MSAGLVEQGSTAWIERRRKVVTFSQPVDQVFGAFARAATYMPHWLIQETDWSNFYLQAVVRPMFVPVGMVFYYRNHRLLFVTCRPHENGGTQVTLFCRNRWLAKSAINKFMARVCQEPMQRLVALASQLLN